MSRRLKGPLAPLIIDLDRPIRTGMLYIVVGFLGFLFWAAVAPLSSAAVAPGVVVADSRNKDIQHLEGGIIHEVLVREGARVAAGQVLVRLDSAIASANLGRLRSQRIAGQAEEARLIAERDGQDHVAFPPELLKATDDPDAVEAVKGQVALFETHLTQIQSEETISAQRIAQYQEEINGISAQIASEDRQLGLIEEELADVRTLYAKGLERKPRLLQLERTAADLSGQRGAHVADVSRARQNIAETQERLVSQRADRSDKTGMALRDVQSKLAEINKEVAAASDASRRLDVTAPVSGKIISIYHEAPGGVVKPGETIMELLPDQDQLVIEAELKPNDIPHVVPNAPARVRLTAYSQRRTSSLEGRVEMVSPDRIVDAKGEKGHYLARIAVTMSKEGEREGLQLTPGMPAMVFIETGKQTMLDYLLSPLFGGIERGFREQ
jgi:HlyD family type I secretion membrane fusion protein